jgi:hypothetical protein
VRDRPTICTHCRSLFVLFLLAIVLSILLRFWLLFGVFKLLYIPIVNFLLIGIHHIALKTTKGEQMYQNIFGQDPLPLQYGEECTIGQTTIYNQNRRRIDNTMAKRKRTNNDLQSESKKNRQHNGQKKKDKQRLFLLAIVLSILLRFWL